MTKEMFVIPSFWMQTIFESNQPTKYVALLVLFRVKRKILVGEEGLEKALIL